MELEFWKKYLADYDQIVLNSFSYQQMMDEVIKIVLKFENGKTGNAIKILDVGTGTGNFIKLFMDYKDKKSKYNIFGIDYDSVALKIAQEKCNDKNVFFQKADLSNNNTFFQGNFDVIVCLSVIWNISDVVYFLKNLYNNLNNNSLLIISFPSMNSNRSKIFLNDLKNGLFLNILKQPTLIKYFIRNIKYSKFKNTLNIFYKKNIDKILLDIGFSIVSVSKTYAEQFKLIVVSK